MVSKNDLFYSKEQVCRVKAAQVFLCNCGCPSPVEALHLLTDGNIWGISLLMREDLERAYKIYGQYPEYVRGKLTKKVNSRAPVDLALPTTEKRQVLYVTVIHVDGMKFLITVCGPLNLMIQMGVKSECRNRVSLQHKNFTGIPLYSL
jgi:hypothetical protein